MKITMQLDTDKDLIVGTHSDGAATIGICAGHETVQQTAVTKLATNRGSLWFNLSFGLEKEGIFFATKTDPSELLPIQNQLITEALLGLDGVDGVDGLVEQIRISDNLYQIKTPCMIVGCEVINLGVVNV
jgi:hypothetical protein